MPAFIPIPSLRDAESQRLGSRMTTLARDMASCEAIATFATTGWLPDGFFAHLAELYTTYDAYITHNIEASALKIQCKAGCSRCCRQAVHGVFSFEIINLYRQLRPHVAYTQLHEAFSQRANAFEAILAEVSRRIPTNPLHAEDPIVVALRAFAARNEACPLLIDNQCSIYEYRPVPCRMYHSLTSPILCVTPIGRTFNLQPPAEADHILCALNDRLAFPNCEFLAQGLVTLAAQRQFRPWGSPPGAS